MRWTLSGAADERLSLRTAKSCGPDASTLASSWREATSSGHGDNKARSPGRARRKPLTPLRAGMPGSPVRPVVTTLVCFLFFAYEAAGASSTRHSPRPLNFRRLYTMRKLARPARRERGGVWGNTAALDLLPLLWGEGWHIVSGANDVTGGGCFRKGGIHAICPLFTYPALRATLPTRGGGIRGASLRS